ncbi:MAG: carboxypeptidase-like regulatory domain-containing protein [Reichenbachiella sp.]|uniref:carboxypeptidase-like regulatory domain-containing protein n=1 Tax=Reichenbachiella sp. TaxID=2184521 RepID=UPI003262D2BD
MKSRLHLSIYCFLISCFSIQAQDFINIKGQVVDQETKEPLAFATINLAGRSRGAVSNFLGEFNFNISNSSENDTLTISMLGYKTYKLAINRIPNPSNLTITMLEDIVMLNELVVSDKELTAKEIVEKVIENIPNNYPTRPYLLNGFTRAHKMECDKYVSLYEADFDLYGRGYNSKSKVGYPEKIYLNEMRASNKVDQYMVQPLESNRNPFVALGHINDVLLKSFSLNISRNTYHLENYTTLNDRLVYVIITGKDHGPMRPNNRMYIDVDTYALIKVDYEIDTPEGEDWNPALYKGSTIGLTKDSLSFKVKRVAKSVQFEEQNGLYILKYTNWFMSGIIFNSESKEDLCDWGAQFEMMFSNVILDNVERPSKKRLLKPKGRTDPKVIPYNETFWKNYDLITEFPLNEQIEAGLSKEIDLETQFRERAKKGE